VQDAFDISCQQILMQDATVFSRQQMDLPWPMAEGLSPATLLERYMAHIRRFTLGIIQPTRSEHQVLFRLAGTRLALLAFEPPKLSQTGDETSLTLAICGGMLVQRDSCDRGELVFSCTPLPQGMRLSLSLSDYCPLLLGSPTPKKWRKTLYRLTQAAIHKVVTVRFLKRLHREHVGQKACCRVVRVPWREGENI